MAPDSHHGTSVLIVDPDPGIRSMIETVLKHAGFRAVPADDLDTAAATLDLSSFAVIVCDLNLAPAARRRALQRLTATEPELLRRTIVMTTASGRATTSIRPGTVFAIVGKPFDIEHLVNTVQACARGSRDVSRPVQQPRLESLRRFVNAVPALKHVLSAPVSCQREAVLRAEMRRTLGVLSATLLEAAHGEASGTRAAVLRGASTVAARLAQAPAPASANAAGTGRDH